MDATLSNDTYDQAVRLGALIAEHKGISVVVLDLRGLNSWTDFLMVATVTSSAHQRGLQRHIKDFATESGMEILRRRRKAPAEDEWNLIDMGSVVVNLMTERARKFYDLERLWGIAPVIWKSAE